MSNAAAKCVGDKNRRRRYSSVQGKHDHDGNDLSREVIGPFALRSIRPRQNTLGRNGSLARSDRGGPPPPAVDVFPLDDIARAGRWGGSSTRGKGPSSWCRIGSHHGPRRRPAGNSRFARSRRLTSPTNLVERRWSADALLGAREEKTEESRHARQRTVSLREHHVRGRGGSEQRLHLPLRGLPGALRFAVARVDRDFESSFDEGLAPH